MLKLPLRAAAIDIGTNSFRLLIADVTSSGLIPLTNILTTVRLGSRLEATRKLAPGPRKRALETLATFKAALREWQPHTWRACGTAALRLAHNSRDFLAQASDLLGGEVEILRGEEEAALCLGGALAQLPASASKKKGPLLLADVGGGSTELAFTAAGTSPLPFPWRGGSESPGSPLSVTSLSLGAVSLTERWLPWTRTSPTEFAQLEQRLTEHLAPALAELLPEGAHPPQILATGGTATALAALDLDLVDYSVQRVQGHVLSTRRLTELTHSLIHLPGPERSRLPGLDQRRGEIILAGACVYQALVKLLNARQMMISDAGLLEGILLSQVAVASRASGVGDEALPRINKKMFMIT